MDNFIVRGARKTHSQAIQSAALRTVAAPAISPAFQAEFGGQRVMQRR
jgi:hypothetical protein